MVVTVTQTARLVIARQLQCNGAHRHQMQQLLDAMWPRTCTGTQVCRGSLCRVYRTSSQNADVGKCVRDDFRVAIWFSSNEPDATALRDLNSHMTI